MPDPKDPRHNAAWRAARQWQQRAHQARPSGSAGGLRLLFTWLVFGALMVVGVVLGLFFLLVGWAMLPFLRHRMKKRMERMRAEQAEDVGGGVHYRETRSPDGRRDMEVLEGDYEVRERRDEEEWR
ncbi:hypothetical protein [Halomonas koreensis]|uniref:DUF3742 family protein n=1 Tax=Halomonas koreensis TaxID=245385 RepID=A0ABU1G725_9GAMM|nr:hypothetical protein [Halomonas koreensis]MDR5868343.1 hypothetical protein [Halomonas koreensis]